jgi:dTDP-4-dehydrorhamnose reductase
MKILIFGAAGMIGHRIWLEAQSLKEAEVFGVVRKAKSHYQKFKIFNDNIHYEIDVSSWSKVEEILAKVRPDVIVNALGITIRKPEMSDVQKSLEINSFFPRRLLKWAQENSSRVIHLSTDCVFDGSTGQYLETSQPSAKDNYGKTKFLGEIEGQSALTLRFSCIGRELDSHTELLDWYLLQNGKNIKGFGKAIYSGVTTQVVAREVIRMVTQFPELNGLFQLSSSPISKYDLLCLVQKVYGTNGAIIRNDDYIADKTLVCEKYKKVTGFSAPTWQKMVEDLYQDRLVDYKI